MKWLSFQREDVIVVTVWVIMAVNVNIDLPPVINVALEVIYLLPVRK